MKERLNESEIAAATLAVIEKIKATVTDFRKLEDCEDGEEFNDAIGFEFFAACEGTELEGAQFPSDVILDGHGIETVYRYVIEAVTYCMPVSVEPAAAADDTAADGGFDSAADSAADAEWQEQHVRDYAMDTIRSMYPPDCGSEKEASKTLFLAVYECGWETLPTPILLRMAELQLALHDKQFNASLAKCW